MPRSHGRRCAFLGIVLAAASGCTLLVSTAGLTGGDDGGVALTDDSGVSASEAGATVDDAGEPGTLRDSAVPTDSSTDSGETLALDSGEGDAARGDAAKGDAGCSNDLSNIGTGDFQISFVFHTALAGKVALANQRTSCGSGVFWDIRLVNGQIYLELDGAAGYSQLITSGPDLDDGASHTISAARTSGTTTITVDASVEGTTGTGAGVSLTALPPVAVETDVCDSANDGGGGGDGTVPSPGAVSGLCVASF